MKKELTLDRIEENKAVFLTEEEEEIRLPAAWFEDLHEGMASCPPPGLGISTKAWRSI